MWTLRCLQGVAFLTPRIPAQIGYAICWIIGVTLAVANAPARRHVLSNLRRVVPHAGPLQRRWHALRVFVTVVTNYYDLIRLGTVDRTRIRDLFEVQGWEHLESALAAGRGVIILSAHVGNYNVVPSYPAALGYPTAVVAERVHPEPLFDYVSRLRATLGVEVVPPGSEALRPIVRLLRRNGILLVAADRDVAGNGIPVPLFGEPTRLPTGPVLLAMRTGAALVPAATLRRRNRPSLAFIEPAIELVRTDDWEADLRANLRQMARALERMIARDPGQWGVLQPVWDNPPRTVARLPWATRPAPVSDHEAASRSASTTR
ncbi:MAG: lysophospholipid acyltransferase family protein [Sphaerobacter sp.]|nr:lysophospholipid acyltransferase family protein [Sphaerobacter sp.]